MHLMHRKVISTVRNCINSAFVCCIVSIVTFVVGLRTSFAFGIEGCFDHNLNLNYKERNVKPGIKGNI